MKDSIPAYISSKASALLQQLKAGEHWSRLGGRKLYSKALRVVFKLPSHYRLVCWYEHKSLNRSETMSHERYNSIARNTRR